MQIDFILGKIGSKLPPHRQLADIQIVLETEPI